MHFFACLYDNSPNISPITCLFRPHHHFQIEITFKCLCDIIISIIIHCQIPFHEKAFSPIWDPNNTDTYYRHMSHLDVHEEKWLNYGHSSDKYVTQSHWNSTLRIQQQIQKQIHKYKNSELRPMDDYIHFHCLTESAPNCTQ